VLSFFHVPSDPTEHSTRDGLFERRRGRGRRLRALRWVDARGLRQSRAASAATFAGKVFGTTLLVWIYCKPLKFHKTTKTFLGKTWHWNHINLEMLGKILEVDRLNGGGPSGRRLRAGSEGTPDRIMARHVSSC